MRPALYTLILSSVLVIDPVSAQIDFDLAVDYRAGQNPAGLAVADLDGVLGPDLAVTSDVPEKVRFSSMPVEASMGFQYPWPSAAARRGRRGLRR